MLLWCSLNDLPQIVVLRARARARSLRIQRRRTEDAVDAYRQAVVLSAGAYTGAKYAELLIRLERYGEAETELLTLDRRFPNDERVNWALGKLYRARGQFSRAEVYVFTFGVRQHLRYRRSWQRVQQ
jgi:Flp pilus assembly protein TadD